MAGQERVEGGEVARFLGVHVLHQWPQVRVRFDDGWRLRGVDECCSEFAGLIDTELEPGRRS